MPDYIDAETVASVSSPTGVDVAAFVESATINFLSSLTSLEVYAGVDAATIISVAAIDVDERGPFSDAATIASTSAFSIIDKFTHPTGQWGPFDIENGQLPIDDATIITKTKVISSEIYA